jgi:hypothetical protein
MKINSLLAIGSIAVGSIALNLVTVQQAQAAFLTNGDFVPTGVSTSFYAGGSYGSGTDAKVAGWTFDPGGYNFVVPSGDQYRTNLNAVGSPTGLGSDSSLFFYGTAPLNSPNGAGAWFVAADGAFNTARISQDLTGLTVGQQYSVSFYQAAAQQNTFAGDTVQNWVVNVGGTYTAPTYDGGGNNVTFGDFTGGTTYNAPTMNLASQGNAGSQTFASGPAPVNGWQQDSFAFTATATTQKLSFLAKGTPSGTPPFALLAGVSASQLPEPADYMGTLVAFGFAGLVIKSRLAKKKLDE